MMCIQVPADNNQNDERSAEVPVGDPVSVGKEAYQRTGQTPNNDRLLNSMPSNASLLGHLTPWASHGSKSSPSGPVVVQPSVRRDIDLSEIYHIIDGMQHEIIEKLQNDYGVEVEYILDNGKNIFRITAPTLELVKAAKQKLKSIKDKPSELKSFLSFSTCTVDITPSVNYVPRTCYLSYYMFPYVLHVL
jgi:hypothetical protein